MIQTYDDWVDENPTRLDVDHLTRNVKNICSEDGKMHEEFFDSHWAKVLSKHSMPGLGISSALTGWIGDVSQNKFYQFRGSFSGINGDSDHKRFSLSIVDGYYDLKNEAIVEGDQFCDLKLDTKSLQDAISDVLSGSVILVNAPGYDESVQAAYTLDRSYQGDGFFVHM